MKKRLLEISILIVIALCLMVACAGSQITKATNTINAVRDFYNGMPPIYDAFIKDNPTSKDGIEAFDKEMNAAIKTAYDGVIAAKASGDLKNYNEAKAHIIEIINRYGGEKWMQDASIKAAIDILEQLLGVKK